LPSRYQSRAKMPSTLRWRCRPIMSNQRRNSRSLAAAAETRARSRARYSRTQPHARARPGDVAILQQRDEVVGDRAVERVLEIDDAGVALRQDHQVARVIVAVHEHARLGQRLGDQQIEARAQQGSFLGVEGEAEMAARRTIRASGPSRARAPRHRRAATRAPPSRPFTWMRRAPRARHRRAARRDPGARRRGRAWSRDPRAARSLRRGRPGVHMRHVHAGLPRAGAPP
jgi:hypothetical protein